MFTDMSTPVVALYAFAVTVALVLAGALVVAAIVDDPESPQRITISAWVTTAEFERLSDEYPLGPPPCEDLQESPDYDAVLTGKIEMVKVPCDLVVD